MDDRYPRILPRGYSVGVKTAGRDQYELLLIKRMVGILETNDSRGGMEEIELKGGVVVQADYFSSTLRFRENFQRVLG